MREKKIYILFMAAFFLIFSVLAVQCTKAQPDKQVKPKIERTITGKIWEWRDGKYFIISNVGTRENFTILNPEPKILDEYTQSGKIVDIDVQVISGDNIKIMTIDGQNYPKDIK